jgi:hypothetical protein
MKRPIAKVVKVLKAVSYYPPTDTVLDWDVILRLKRTHADKRIKVKKANFSFICSDLSNISDYVRQIDWLLTLKSLKALYFLYTLG